MTARWWTTRARPQRTTTTSDGLRRAASFFLAAHAAAALQRGQVLGDDLARLGCLGRRHQQLAPGARRPVAPHLTVPGERGAAKKRAHAVVLEHAREQRACRSIGYAVHDHGRAGADRPLVGEHDAAARAGDDRVAVARPALRAPARHGFAAQAGAFSVAWDFPACLAIRRPPSATSSARVASESRT